MQPTVPAWVSWYRRLRPAELAAELARARDRPAVATRVRAPNRVAVYTSVFNSMDDANLHLIRFDDMVGSKRIHVPTPPNDLLKRLNINTDIWRAHIAPDLAKSAIDYQQRFHNYPPVSIMVPPSGGAMGTGSSSSIGSHGARGHGGHATGGAVWGGWAAGAVLLALLVLIVRAAEKCLDRRLFKNTRRQSEEWSTPNVMATSLQQQNLDGSLPGLDDSEFSSPSQRNADLPPPYSECAPTNNANVNKNFNKLGNEEPPPPYSACLVAFSNKDIPTVHIHRRNTINEPQTSSEIDNVHNDLIETRHRIDTEQNYDDGIMRVELVFDNGRIVERTIDIENTENVPEIVVNVGDTVIGNGSTEDNVAYVDDNVAQRTPDRVIFV